jgi:hypothetical protein
MSYSIRFDASTKNEAKAKVAVEFDAIVEQQPNHAKDRALAIANANAAIDLLADDDSQDISVDVYGSLMWVTDPDKVTGVTIHASAWHLPPRVAPSGAE